MVRPHPAVWRLVHGLMVVYLCLLVFLLFQTPGDARLFMRWASAKGCGSEGGRALRAYNPVL